MSKHERKLIPGTAARAEVQAVAVPSDTEKREALVTEAALLRDIQTAEAQIDAGQVAPHSVAARRLKARRS